MSRAIQKINRRALIRAGIATLPAISAGTLPAVGASAPAGPVAKLDPIFAAIKLYDQMFNGFIALCRTEDEQAERGVKSPPAADDHRTPEMVAAVNASVAARRALANTAPTTPAGLAAYLDWVVSSSVEAEQFAFDDNDGFDGPDEVMMFVRSLARAAHGMAGLQPWEGAAASPRADGHSDPIFAAIEAHHQAWEILNHMTSSLDEAGKDEEVGELTTALSDAIDAFVDTAPTTPAGVIALLRHAAEIEGRDGGTGSYFEDEDGKTKPLCHFVYLNLAAAIEDMPLAAVSS